MADCSHHPSKLDGEGPLPAPIFFSHSSAGAWEAHYCSDVLFTFNKYVLSTYYVPGISLGVGDTAMNEANKNSALKAGILAGGGTGYE